MESRSSDKRGSGVQPWTALALCGAVLVAGALEPLVRHGPGAAPSFAPNWVPLAAAGLAAAGIVRLDGRLPWRRVQPALRWSGLLLMLWAANGLPFDLLRLAGAIPLPVSWAGLATKTLALAALVMLARLVLARPAAPAAKRPASWYGYAAFALALPYPVLRTHWALGGMLGLSRPGAGGQGWAPWLLAIPWLAAAALSLLLVPTWRWMPRRLLLTAGWTATAITGMIGPVACLALVSALAGGGAGTPPAGPRGPVGIAFWVFALFYGSWFLFAIAAGAATRSYQVRSASPPDVPTHVSVTVGA
jgi:DHA1 family inner membrane transport protein